MAESTRCRATSRRIILGLSVALAAPRIGLAQSGPLRPTRMLTPAASGTSADVAARMVAEALAQLRAHPIMVENRTGADGTLAAAAFAQARPGDALFFTFSGALTIAPLLHRTVSYDPVADFAPLSAVADDGFVLSVASDVPAATLPELVALARTRPPGTLNWFAAPGGPYLAFRAFLRETGLDMTYVSYRGAPAALLDLVAGRIQVVLGPLAPTLGPARDGRLRMIAVTTEHRSPAAPDLPTTAEAGMPGLRMQGLLGLLGWRGMPEAARQEFSHQTRQVLADPAFAARFRTAGMAPRSSTPAQFAAELDADRSRWAALAREFGAQPPA